MPLDIHKITPERITELSSTADLVAYTRMPNHNLINDYDEKLDLVTKQIEELRSEIEKLVNIIQMIFGNHIYINGKYDRDWETNLTSHHSH